MATGDRPLVDYAVGIARRVWAWIAVALVVALEALDRLTDWDVEMPGWLAGAIVLVGLAVASFLTYRDVWNDAHSGSVLMLKRLRDEAESLLAVNDSFDRLNAQAWAEAIEGVAPENIHHDPQVDKDFDEYRLDLTRRLNIGPWLESVRALLSRSEREVFDAGTPTEPWPGNVEDLTTMAEFHRFVRKRIQRLDEILARR